MVSPSTLDRRHSTPPDYKPPIRLWPLLAFLLIMLLLGTNALAWYLLYLDEPPEAAPLAFDAVPTTTFPPELTIAPPIIDPGDLGVHGRHDYRGNIALTGETDGGFRDQTGVYWEPVQPGGFFGADPIAYGRFLYVVSATHDVVYAVDQTTGVVSFTMQTNGRMQTAPAVGQFTETIGKEATETSTRLVVVSEDGIVYSRSALGVGGARRWESRLQEDVSAAPLVTDGKIIVATESGSIIAIGGDSEVLWRYLIPALQQTSFSTAPAIANGIVYAADDTGRLHLVSLDDGTELCRIALGVRPTSHPLIADDRVVIPADGTILVLEAGECEAAPRLIVDQVNSPLAPAYAAGTLFAVENSFLMAWDLATLAPSVWNAPFTAESRITTAPTVAGGVVYFGTQDGIVHAVDGATGEAVWQFEVGQPIFGGPVITTNGIFVTTAQEIISIAGE